MTWLSVIELSSFNLYPLAVKELVENALDAGATNIECKVNELDIECIDNGSGIEEANWPLLCQKYTTSKIEKFEDLASVLTYGFRGEALSSLCAVSKTLTATTRTGSMECGRRLHYDIGGKLTKTELVSRQVGTTISVSGIFHNLPVRRMETINKMKQEITKMTALIASYAIINEGVKISCIDSKRFPVIILTC